MEGEIAVVGEDEQAFAVAIEAADVKKPRHCRGRRSKTVRRSWVSLAVQRIAAGFVEQDVEVLLGEDAAVADFDEILIGDIGGQIPAACPLMVTVPVRMSSSQRGVSRGRRRPGID